MKLLFKKEEDGTINVRLQKGTILEDFSYVEMIKGLLQNNDFNDSEFDGLSEDEEKRVKEMLSDIVNVVNDANEEEETE